MGSACAAPSRLVANPDLDEAPLDGAPGGPMQAPPHFLDHLLAVGRAQIDQELPAGEGSLVVLRDNGHVPLRRAGEARVVGGGANVVPADDDRGRLGPPVALVAVEREGVALFILASVAQLMPVLGSLTALWRGVVEFHFDAEVAYARQQPGNWPRILAYMRDSLATYAALYGVVLATSRRDWRVAALIGWLLATLVLLWRQTPMQLTIWQYLPRP